MIGEEPDPVPGGYYLIDFVPSQQSLSLRALEGRAAFVDYFESEEESSVEVEHDFVLVGGSSLDRIKRLYPNYFGNISSFIDLVEHHLDAFA